MDLFTNKINAHPSLNELSQQLEQLIVLLKSLKHENNTLLQQQNQLLAERDSLLEKNHIARTRVESMISRLKALEESAQ